MKTPWYIFIVIATLLLGSIAAHTEHYKIRGKILVSMDFTEALAKALTVNTTIKVIRVIPPGYSPDTHSYYLKKNQQSFGQHAQDGDAVISIMGAWPGDPLYPSARKANIRIVPIDIVAPLDGSQAGVALPSNGHQTDGDLFHVWNSPGNCARMADIAASDLVRLFPEAEEAINDNLTHFKKALFKIRTRYEIKFSTLQHFEAGAFTTDHLALTNEFGIQVTEFFLKPEIRWQEADFQDLEERIVFSKLPAVLCKWQPKEEIAQKIVHNGASMVILKSFKLGKKEHPAKQLLDFYATNLGLLFEGLSQNSKD